jgi:HD-GYP domain-containing protein (c-di-GMP phosphodiesterase class II)
MIFVQPDNLKPGMVLARDLLGPRNEVLLTRGHQLTAANIARLNQIDHKDVYIVDNLDEVTEADEGIISLRLKRNTVNAVRALFSHIEAGNREAQSNSFLQLRHYLDEIIDELSADRSMLVNMADLKAHDDYTYYHSVSVATLSILLGISANMNRTALYKLGMGALMHDIGKVFISRDLLNKPSTLTTEEFEKMKLHSSFGYDYLREQWGGPVESVVAVLTHHERYDGGGYPFGLMGDKQPLEGKIIALSDVYDAMTSDRAYHSALPPSEAIEHIMGNSGILFDPQVVRAFMNRVVPYPVGSRVRLSNGLTAIVVATNKESLMRPKVKPINIDKQEVRVDDVVLDLLNDPALWSVTILGLDRQKAEANTFDQCTGG